MEVLCEVRIRFGRSVEGRLPGSIPIHWKVETGIPCNGTTKFVPIWNRDFSPVGTWEHLKAHDPPVPVEVSTEENSRNTEETVVQGESDHLLIPAEQPDTYSSFSEVWIQLNIRCKVHYILCSGCMEDSLPNLRAGKETLRG